MYTLLEKRIINLLLEKRWLKEEQLEDVEEEAKRTGRGVLKILTEDGYVPTSGMLKILSKEFGMDPIDLAATSPDSDVLSLLDAATARLYRVIPVRKEGNTLYVAISDPYNSAVLDDLRFILNMDIYGYLADDVSLQEALDKYYGKVTDKMDEVISELDQALPAYKEEEWQSIDISSLEQMATAPPVVRLVNLVLVQAIRDRASDIHFEPFEDEYKVRYRVDGVLYEMIPPPKRLSLAISSRIKVMANLNIAERRLPQDGRIQIHLDGRDIELRISTLPTAFGESIVMRVLDRQVVSLELEELGMEEDELRVINNVIQRPYGIIVVTGPTGAGKTTTLYSCLKKLNKVDTKIITTEDPVEYDIEGLTQIGINENIGLNFVRCLRHILRHDPDKIMVGEIRDLETAKMAIQSALTGHLVLTTLHTNDAPESITRLIDMGVEPFLITSTLQVIVAQRLVRKICENCKKSYKPTIEDLESIGLTLEEIKGKEFYYGSGCDSCHHTGYKGRTGIFEILIISDPIRELILEKASTVVIREKAKELGMRILRESGLLKIYRGITTIEEVAKVT